jgi:hypothetical protein
MFKYVPACAAVLAAVLAVAQGASADSDPPAGPGIPTPIETAPCIEYAEDAGNHEFGAYYQPEEVDREVAELARNSAFRTSAVGLSNRGRPIWSVRTGTGPKVIFVQAGIHGNELTGTTAVMNLLKSLDSDSEYARKLRREITLVVVPMLNADGAAHYQRENDQTWAETVERFPQLDGVREAFYYSTPGPRFWGDPRVPGYDLNRDFNPDFDYVPQAGHLPGSGGVRGLNLSKEAKVSQGLYDQLEREFGTVDVFVDLHNQAPCNDFDHDGDPSTPTQYTPMSISAQFLSNPAAHGAGTTYPKFDYDASRRANVAAWLGVQPFGCPASNVTRYPQNLNLAGSANGSYQLRGSASVLMEAGRQRHANPEWNVDFIAAVHENAVRGIINSVVDGWFSDIDPNRYEQIPVRNNSPRGGNTSCPVEAPGEVGGEVPATLSLVTGPAATFGAFTPGVAQDYTTSLSATVISTAANATLTIADPSSSSTGHLVNGSFSLPSPLTVKAGAGPFAPVGGSAAPTPLAGWSGPVSNASVPIDFRQSIGANDALRTGSYAKTLTLTLTTTEP